MGGKKTLNAVAGAKKEQHNFYCAGSAELRNIAKNNAKLPTGLNISLPANLQLKQITDD